MGTWIEMQFMHEKIGPGVSFPAMGTWIEILYATSHRKEKNVVPCNGNVD